MIIFRNSLQEHFFINNLNFSLWPLSQQFLYINIATEDRKGKKVCNKYYVYVVYAYTILFGAFTLNFYVIYNSPLYIRK